jgi:hypothetical protein
MHSSFDFFLVFLFLLLSQLLLSSNKLSLTIVSLLSQAVSELSCEPASHMTLNIQSCLFSLFFPHFRAEVRLRVDNLVFALINIDVTFLHLGAEFSHHYGGLGLILVGLNNALVSFRMVRSCLIGLGKGMVVSLSRLVVSETANVGLGFALLLNLNLNNLDLVVSKSNFNFKHSWHDEFICFN